MSPNQYQFVLRGSSVQELGKYVPALIERMHKIDSIMDGDLSEITAALAAEHQAEQLASLAQSA